MLGLTGPTEAEHAAAETVNGSLRAEVAKKVALGGGWSVGAAIVFGAFELLHNDSKDAFPLLRSWGPWAIVSMIAVYVFYDLAKMVLNIGQRAVIAMENTSVSLSRIADKDDRQLQELQTLTAYSAQESERTSTKMQHLTETTEDTNAAVKAVLAAVQARSQIDIGAIVDEAITKYTSAEARRA